VGVVVALQLGGCSTDPCDIPTLRAAADDLQDADRAGRSAVIAQIAKACPKLNIGVRKGLAMEYGEGLEAGDTYLFSTDVAYTKLMAEICADPEAARAANEDGDEQAVYEACEFSKLKLLEEGELYVSEYRAAFLLYHALVSAGVDKALARRLARGFIESTAASPDLLVLPASTSDLESVGGTQVVIREDALLGPEGLELPLSQGLLGPPGEHMNLALRDGLELHADRVQANAGFELEPQPLLLATHRDANARTLVDVMHTASAAEFTRFNLAVQSRGRGRILPLHVPPRWSRWFRYAREGVRGDPISPPSTTARLTRGKLLIRQGGAKQQVDATDSAAIEALSRELEEGAKDGRIELAVAGDTSVQSLVDVIDALRGAKCRISRLQIDETPPPSCLFTQVELDLVPGIPRRGGSWAEATFKLSVSSERYKGKKGPESVAKLEKRVRDAIPAVHDCLAEYVESSTSRPPYVVFLFAVDEKGQLATHVARFTEYAETLPRQCLEQSIGLPTFGLERISETYAEANIKVDWPSPE